MKTIPPIIALLLLFNPLTAQQTGQPANPAVPGGTTRPNANTGGASAAGGFVAGGQASGAATTGTSTRPSATTGALGMPEFPGVGGGGSGTGTAVPGSLPASNEFAIGLLSEEAEQDLASAAAAYRRTIQAFDRQRTEAANTIFRLGEVYRKMGRIEEAKVQYARILREFPDMVRLTELSHGLLLGEEGRAGTGIGPETGTTATGSSSVTTSGRGPDDLDRILRESYGAGISDRIMLQRYGLKHPLALDERVACISNLKQLGLAARIYAAEKGAVFPPSPALMSNEIAMTKVLVCPSDTTRQPAPSWAEFDPDVHMTYEYLGAGVRENEPQRTLYHCPIHGHVALVDGSVHHGRAPSPGATMQIQPQRVDRSHAESAPSEVDIINTILNRLRQIDGAKEQWALENRQPVGTQPTEQDIINYLPGGWVPIAGERYELKPVGESPVAVLTQPIGNRITGELIGLGSPAVAADVRPIRIRVKADGKVELDGTSIELSELTDRLREFSVDPFRRAPGGHPPTILLLAEEDPSEDVVLAVIHAVLTLRFGQVHAQTTVYPAIQNELERLGKQIDDLREEYDRLARRQTDGDRERVILSQERKEAEAQLRTANRRLDASRTRPELFPDIINKDERYQRLKQEYEAAVLSRDEEAAKRAQEQLKVWVEQIYRPELEAQRDFAIETFNHLHLRLEELDHDLRSWKAAQDRLMEQQRELQARHSQLALLIPPATGS